MSYQVLARKWRPAAFDQMVGQSHVLHALTNALSQQRLHHAYLFTGTRGVGKTSIARLFAKGLNCETGVTATPCGQCSSCVEIAEGRFVDLIEVDAASRTKVDDTRELLDNVQYRPTRGRFKVYLIDEVHMLSKSSFNALLKTLEEPPEHVKFLLATTDPQKLPVTVLSRCLQFNLKSLTQDEITRQLQHVLSEEKIDFETQALTLLAKSANGSMRDGLSLTDQAIAFGAGQVMLAQVQTMLGSVDERSVIALLDAIIEGEVSPLLMETAQILAFGADADEVLRSLLELLHQITLTQFAQNAAQLSLFETQIKAFAQQLEPEQVQLYYQILLAGRKELPHAPDPKSGLEMALLRAVAFRPQAPTQNWQPETPFKPIATDIQPSAAAPAAGINNRGIHATATKSEEGKGLVETNNETGREQLGSELDETPVDSQLLAEQALILSQAQSQGFDLNSDDDLVPMAQLLAQDSAYDSEQTDDDFNLDSNVYFNVTPEPSTLKPEASALKPEPSALKPEPNANGNAGLIEEGAPTAPSVNPTMPAFELGDDILDAVLATRESLLSELEQHEAKVGEAKKPELNATLQRRGGGKPTASETAKNQQSEDVSAASSTELSSTPQSQAIAPVIENTLPVAEERPPWESSLDDEQSKVSDSTSNDIEALPSAEAQTQQSKSEDAGEAEVTHVLQPTSQAPLIRIESTTEQIQGHSIDLHWYKLMSQLDIGGRVRQLAVNSVCQALTMPLSLLLKPDQKHLSAEVAINQLQNALSDATGQPCEIKIDVGVDPQRETPLEIRKRLHRELLGQTRASLLQDDNIQWMMAQLAADLVEDSLAYPPEMLSQKSQGIASLPFQKIMDE